MLILITITASNILLLKRSGNREDEKQKNKEIESTLAYMKNIKLTVYHTYHKKIYTL